MSLDVFSFQMVRCLEVDLNKYHNPFILHFHCLCRDNKTNAAVRLNAKYTDRLKMGKIILKRAVNSEVADSEEISDGLRLKNI